jgi:hypothetical protein
MSQAPASKAGWLVKKARSGILLTGWKWQKRYFVLDEGKLAYFSKEQANTAKAFEAN